MLKCAKRENLPREIVCIPLNSPIFVEIVPVKLAFSRTSLWSSTQFSQISLNSWIEIPKSPKTSLNIPPWDWLGWKEGAIVGLFVGDWEGTSDGVWDENLDGTFDGDPDGT